MLDLIFFFLQGTKFQLKCVEEYIVTTGSGAPSYYMTLVAIDDTAGGGGSSSLQTFQIQVSQESRGQFILTCDIARIRGKNMVALFVFLQLNCVISIWLISGLMHYIRDTLYSFPPLLNNRKSVTCLH